MDKCRKFNVAGAGKIEISKQIGWSCGDADGFHFGVSWGKYGYAGGVIDKAVAKKLADHIYKTLKLPSPPKP